MLDALKKLNEIGINTIHDKTHISIHSLKAILQERFSDINSIQYIGFLNIIEANFKIDLTKLREKHQEYLNDISSKKSKNGLFVDMSQTSKNHKPLIISIIAIIFIIIFISTISTKTITNRDLNKTQNSAIKSAYSYLSAVKFNKVDKNQTKTKNISNKTQEVKKDKEVSKINREIQENILVDKQKRVDDKKASSSNQEIKKDQNISKGNSLVIYPKQDLWIGIINIKTHEKQDTITSAPFVINETNDLLISLGHGLVKIKLNDNLQDFSDNERKRFLYKDNKLTLINIEKFKELNMGENW